MDHSWTGTLLHKGKVISRICIKTAWPIPLPLEDRLELNQKMTQSNFINKVMPRTVKGEQPNSLSLDTPDIYEETVIQVGLVEPIDDSSKHIWTKFSSFLSVSSSVGVSNMEGRGGHLFVATPSEDQGPFESLFANFHEHKSGTMMCVIFLWDTSYLKMATLPDPWGDVITPEEADDDEHDNDIEDGEIDDRDNHMKPPVLTIKNEPDADEEEGNDAAGEEDAETTTAETDSQSAVDDDKTQSAKSGSVLANLALAEQGKLSSKVNPPNPKLELQKINEKLSDTVEGILKLVQTSMAKKTAEASGSAKDAGSVETGRRNKHKPVALQGESDKEDRVSSGGLLQTSGDIGSTVVIKQEQGTSGDNSKSLASRTVSSEREITSTEHSADTFTQQSVRSHDIKREPNTGIPVGQTRPVRLNSDNGDTTTSDLTDGDDITDNDIISAQLIDDTDDDTKPWQDVGKHNGDATVKDDNNESAVFSEGEQVASKQSDGVQSFAGTTSTTTVQRMYGYFKQKSVQSSWGSTQKRARRSCTASAFQVTIPGMNSIRKQNTALGESKDDNQTSTGDAMERQDPNCHLLPARTVRTSKADGRATNGTDIPETLPAVPPAMSPYVICPQTPPFVQDRMTVENNSNPAPFPVGEQHYVGVWGSAESAGRYGEPARERQRTLLEMNTVRILSGVCEALRKEECCRKRCASVVESLVALLQSTNSQQSKDEYSKGILGMLDTLATPDDMSRMKNEVTTTCFPSVEDAGRAFMQSRAKSLQEENALQGQLQSQINVMIQKAKSDLIKDLGLKSPKKKSPRKKGTEPPPTVQHQPHVGEKLFLPFSRKTVPHLKLLPVGSSTPFGRDFGYYSVGARSINYLEHLWYTAFLIAKGGLDKIPSNIVIPIVGSIKRQKQGLQQEFGKEVFRNDMKRRPCRLYKEYDVLHAFFHFHKTVLLANVWFRANYKQMVLQRLQFIHRKLMIQVKYLRQSRDLLRDALQWTEIMDIQRPIFHYAFNACDTFEQRLDCKLAECRANMDQRRAENEKLRSRQITSENVDSSQLEDLDFDCASEQKDLQSLSSEKRSDRDSVSRLSSQSRGRTRSPSAGIRPPSPTTSPTTSPCLSSSSSTSTHPDKKPWPVVDSATVSIDKLIKSGRQREERQRLSLDDSDKRYSSADDNNRAARRKRSSISPRRRRTPSPFRPRRRRSPSSGRRCSRSPLKPRRRPRSRDRSRNRSRDRSRDRIRTSKSNSDGKQRTFPIRPTPSMVKNYKTKLCINWVKHGCCALGEMCCYAHGVEEIKKFST